MKRTLLLIVTLLLSVTAVFAHGGEKHVMGTIVKTSDTSITVKTTDGKNVEIALNSATKFMNGSQAIQAKDLKEGDRVVVHAKEEKEKLTATMVKVGAMNMGHMKSGDMKGMNMGHEGSTTPK